MGHADTERSNGILPPMFMPVILDQRMTMQMHMLFTVMVMTMQMPAFPDQSQPEYGAQKYKHGANAKLRRQRKWLRNLQAEHQHHRPDQQQYYSMSESPTQSDHAGSAKRRSLCEHRGYGNQMVRIQRVTKPQHQPKS